MLRFGLIGYPLGHSFSATYFNNFFSRIGLEARYELYPIADIQALSLVLSSSQPLVGLNVTAPHKVSVLPHVDELDSIAASVGAVNTLSVSWVEGKPYVRGYNTDVLGFDRSLEDWWPSLEGEQALILGTGGAAQAVAYALSMHRMGVTMLSRNPEAARRKIALQRTVSHTLGGGTEGDVCRVLHYEELLVQEVAQDYKLIVQATPIGLVEGEFPRPFPYEAIGRDHLCYDLIYNPSQSIFLRKAQSQGAYTQNGMEMLLYQAQEAWDIWQRDLEIEV